jgi:hypothetical protein
MPGRMIKHDIYGWDVFYPKWRHRRNVFLNAFIESGDVPTPRIETGNQAAQEHALELGAQRHDRDSKIR